MAVIFVHGVNNRIAHPSDGARRQVTEQFLIRSFTGALINRKPFIKVKPVFPYWCDLATKFAWNMKSLPLGEIEALGPGVSSDLRPLVATIRDSIANPTEASEQPLLSLARQSLLRAVDIVTELVLLTATTAQASDAAEFAVGAQVCATEYELPSPPPELLTNVTTAVSGSSVIRERKLDR